MIIELTKTKVVFLMQSEGTHCRTAYANSHFGRTALATEQPPEIIAEVMAVWGDIPTVPDSEPPSPTDPTPPTPTLEQRIAVLEAVQLEQILGGAL